jgi:hypothetical protein
VGNRFAIVIIDFGHGLALRIVNSV